MLIVASIIAFLIGHKKLALWLLIGWLVLQTGFATLLMAGSLPGADKNPQ